MVGGQMLTFSCGKKKLSLKRNFILQKLKTGELFRFACIAGPILSELKNIKNIC